MWLVLVSLLLGCFIGWLGWVPNQWFRYLDRGIMWMLFAMLLSLGAQIGSNRELLEQLSLLGGRAFVISAFSVAGSVVAVWLVSRYIGANRKEEAS